MMRTRALIVTLLCVSTAVADLPNGATYYVVPNGVGRDAADAGTTREDPMDFDYFINYATSDCIGLMQPGHGSYGTLTAAFETTTNKGTVGHPIIWKADPATVTARSADWFSRATELERPNTDTHVVFNSITLGRSRLGGAGGYAGDWNTYVPVYITLDGIWIDGGTNSYTTGSLTFDYTIGGVTIQNCNIFSSDSDYINEVNPGPINMPNNYGIGSAVGDVLIDQCYISGGRTPLKITARMTGNVTISNTHLWNANSSAINYQPNGLTPLNDAWFRAYNVYIDGFRPVADNLTIPLANAPLITELDPVEPRRIFRVASVPSSRNAIRMYDNGVAVGDVLFATEISVNATTRWVTLDEAVDFDIEVNVDKCHIMDIGHGSSVALIGDRIKLVSCVFKENGSSRILYTYKGQSMAPSNYGVNDLWIVNCLAINGDNSAALVDLTGGNGLGDRCYIINNTFIGCLVNQMQYDGYYVSHLPTRKYGLIFNAKFDSDSDPTTSIIANNLIVGYASATNFSTATIKNNHIYYWASTPALDETNTIIYGGEAYGEEPAPFHRAGTYFVADNAAFDNLTYLTAGDNANLTYDYAPKAGSPAIEGGDASYVAAGYETNLDLAGNARTAADVGAIGYGTISALIPTDATTPSPTDGAVSQTNSLTLSWVSGSNTPTHRVFFGTDRDTVAEATTESAEYKGEQANGVVTYATGTLAWSTDYYWRIAEHNDSGDTTGTVWTFQTMAQPTPTYYLIGGNY